MNIARIDRPSGRDIRAASLRPNSAVKIPFAGENGDRREIGIAI